MRFKETLIKILNIAGGILLVLMLAFIIYATQQALTEQQDSNYDKIKEETYVSQDMKSTIIIYEDNKLYLSAEEYYAYYNIKKTENSIIIVEDKDTGQDFAIKIFKDKQIYCEKTREYYFMV